MSEDLIVTIGARDNGLRSTITQINRELRTLDRVYKTSAKSGRTLATSQEALTRKLNYLQQKQTLVNQKLEYYKNKVSQTTQKLDAEKQKLEELKNAEGDHSSEIEKCNTNIARYESQLANATNQVTLAEGELRGLNTAIQETNTAIERAPLLQYQARMEQISKKMDAFGSKLQTIGQATQTLGSGLMALGTPFVALSAYAAKSAIDFETAYTGVTKTVDGTKQQLSTLRKELLEMSKVMPNTADELADIAATAGQLGIKTENIKGFTKVIAELGVATNLTAEQGASDLARFANIVGMSQNNFDRLGSTIVDLGNHFATTESEIVSMGLRLAGAGHQVNMSEADMMGFAAALSSVGIEAEMGGSAFSKLMINMKVATATGGDNLEEFAQVAGMSGAEFKKAFEQDAARAIIKFIQGLSKAKEQGKSAIEILNSMDIKEVRLRDTILRAAGASDIFNDALDRSKNAWQQNTALAKEAETRYATLQSKIDMCKNKLKAMGIELGEQLMPYVSSAIDKLENLVKWFSNLDKGTQKSIIKMGLFTFATGATLKGIGKLTSGLGGTIKTASKFVSWLGRTATASTVVTRTVSTAAEAVEGAAAATEAAGAAAASTTTQVSILGTAFKTLLASTPIILGIAGALGVAAIGIKSYTTYQDIMAKKSTTAKEDLTGFERAIAKITGTTFQSREELEDLGLVLPKLSKNFSGGFRKAVNDSTKAIQEFKFNVDKIFSDNLIDEKEFNYIAEETDKAITNAQKAIESKKKAIKESLSDAFSLDGVQMNPNESVIMDYYNKEEEKSSARVTEIQNKLNEIKKRIRQEGYELTESDRQAIEQYYEELNQIELEQQAKNNEEYTYAEQLFRSRVAQTDSEGASKLYKKRVKEVEEHTAQINAKYNSAIENLKKDYDSMDAKTRASVDNQVALLEQSRQKALENERSYLETDYNLIIENNENLEGYLDKYTGNILSKQDIACSEKLEKMKSHYVGMNEITQSGLYKLYNSEKETWDQVYITVDEKTGDIVAAYSTNINSMGQYTVEAAGYNEKMADSIEDTADKYNNKINSIKFALEDAKRTTVDASGNIINANGKTVASIEKVRYAADGTRTGIINLNGTPVKVVVNKDGTIRNINEIDNKLNHLTRPRIIEVRAQLANGAREGIEAGLRGISVSATVKANLQQGFSTVPMPGNWRGTRNAKKGYSWLAEKGPEIVQWNNGDVSLVDKLSLAKMQGGEIVYNASETKDILDNLVTGGSYFSPRSIESKELVSTTNNTYNNYNNNVNNSLKNSSSITKDDILNIVNAIKGLSIVMDNQKVGTIVDKTMGANKMFEEIR